MKISIVGLLCFLLVYAYAADFAPVGAVWYYNQTTINPDYDTYKTLQSVGDTVINGQLCMKIIESVEEVKVGTQYMFSRNDSVFFYAANDFHLLYNFGAEKGDTVVLDYFTAAVDGGKLLMIVDSVSTININGINRKVQYVSCGDGLVVEFGGQIIEGIGSFHYMFPTYDNTTNGALRCYSDNNLGHFKAAYWKKDCDYIPGLNRVVRFGPVWSVNDKKYSAGRVTLKNGRMYTDFFMTQGDTVFDTENAKFVAHMREQNGKVWYLEKDSVTEKLLYDFSLKVGESTTVYPMCNLWKMGTTGISVTVFAIDTIEINSKKYKRLKVSGCSHGEFWIESIGSTSGLFGSGLGSLCIADIDLGLLYCYTDNGHTEYFAEPGVCYAPIFISTQKLSISSVRVFPNPFTDVLNIRVEPKSEILYFEMFNLLGQPVLKQNISKQEMTMNLREIGKGGYIFRIVDGETIVYTGKIIKQ